jgi:hypothetical protein
MEENGGEDEDGLSPGELLKQLLAQVSVGAGAKPSPACRNTCRQNISRRKKILIGFN